MIEETGQPGKLTNPLERLKAVVKNLRLIDDVFMSRAFDGNLKATQLLLRSFTGKRNIELSYVKTQHSMQSPLRGGRKVIFDVFTTDTKGRCYDLEFQRSKDDSLTLRARVYSAALNARMLKAGDEFSKLHDTYVVIVTEKDFFGMGKAVYKIKKTIEGTNRTYEDGEHVIFVNGEYANLKTTIGRIVHDLYCVNTNDMLCEELRDTVRHFKETPKGEIDMCAALQELIDSNTAKVTAEVTEKITKKLEANLTERVTKKLEADLTEKVTKKVKNEMTEKAKAEVKRIANSLYEDGMSLSKIAKIVKVSAKTLKSWLPPAAAL